MKEKLWSDGKTKSTCVDIYLINLIDVHKSFYNIQRDRFFEWLDQDF
jgi:hypothetical protein